jgi:hypothetical protein
MEMSLAPEVEPSRAKSVIPSPLKSAAMKGAFPEGGELEASVGTG